MQQICFKSDGSSEKIEIEKFGIESGTDYHAESKIGTFACEILSIDSAKFSEEVSKLDNYSDLIKDEKKLNGFFLDFTIFGSDASRPCCKNFNTVFSSLLQISRTAVIYMNSTPAHIVKETRKLPNLLEKYKSFWNLCEVDKRYRDFDFFNFLCEIEYFQITIPMSGHKTYPSNELSKEGEKIESLFEIYTTEKLKDRFFRNYMANSFSEVLSASTRELLRFGKTIKFCKICGKAFVPVHRSDTAYCSSQCPLDNTMTCKDYAAKRLWYDKIKEDELATLSRNIYSAKQMLAKRNPDIPEYAVMFENYKKERIKMKNDYKEGRISAEEYLKWLNEMKDRKL